MNKYTEDQRNAILIDTGNVLVSAAAGSGKTAVLTERIVQKLLTGTDIEQLIVLTFTNFASQEMKARIEKKVLEHDSLKKQADKISTASITTFDGYSLSLVKKYHYLLNLDSNVNIGEAVIFDFKLNEVVKEVIDNYYQNDTYLKLLIDYTVFDDKEIIDYIKSLYKSINTMVKPSFNIEQYFKQTSIDNYYHDYELLIKKHINKIIDLFKVFIIEVDCIDGEKYYNDLYDNFTDLFSADTYNSVKQAVDKQKDYQVTRSKKMNNVEEIKIIVKKIKAEHNSLKKLLIYDNKETMVDMFINTKEYAILLAEITMKVYDEMNNFKLNNNIFDFSDIKRLSIQLLENNQYIANEIRDNTKEILLDEYQDTDDIQEYFISLISNDNVYMVGDMKQSIYRFRNANPDIFQDKLSRYSVNNGGNVLSLNKNFRSNNEVITSINKIFSSLMTKEVGGVTYDSTQQLNFGNTSFLNQNIEHNYDLEILSYDLEGSDLSANEYEANLIAQDIKEKIATGFEVISSGQVKKLTYQDIAILMRSKSEFDIFKKVFEQHNIPLMIDKDSSFKLSYEIVVIKAILGLITNDFTNNKYNLISLLRSFLYDFTDQEIHHIVSKYNNENIIKYLTEYPDERLTVIGEQLNELKKMDILVNNVTIIHKLVDIFKIIDNSFKLYEGNLAFNRVIELKKIAENYDQLNLTLFDLYQFLSELNDSKYDISFKTNGSSATNVVTMMTIHKSKGLEYPLCYMARLDKKFNKRDLNKQFLYSDKYGVLIPAYNDYLYPQFIKKLIEEEYISEMISEELRLFYVGLTRAESKLIFISNLKEESHLTKIDQQVMLSCNSYQDFLNLISNQLDEHVRFVDEIKPVNDVRTDEDINNIPIIYTDYNNKSELITKTRISKLSNQLNSIETSKLLNYGNELHKDFELFDFTLKESDNKYIQKFIDTNLLDKMIEYYPEYEYIFYKDEVRYNGIIDLLVEKEDCFLIIDYKTKNIDDPSYIKQMQAYYDFVSSKTDKAVKCYLYSIIDGTFEEVNN